MNLAFCIADWAGQGPHLGAAQGRYLPLAVLCLGEPRMHVAPSSQVASAGALMGLVGGGQLDVASLTLGCAGDWATRPVISLPACARVQQAADVLFERRIKTLPLTGEPEAGQAPCYVGLISRAEVDTALRHGFADRPAKDFCGPAPGWVPAQMPMAQVGRTLAAGLQGLVLVGDGAGAIGVLTRRLLLRASFDPASGVAGQRLQRPPLPQALWDVLQGALAAQWTAVMQLVALGERLQMPMYVVGGQVRDVLQAGTRSRPQASLQHLGDIDLVVEGNAQMLARAAVAAFGGTQTLSANPFMTARWQPGSGPGIDLATARSEYYAAPGALPQVRQASLSQDLWRRDFTLNAMALGLSGKDAGRVFDPHGGFADLQAGQLRVLHGLSFYDDPTRVLRAARFAARFNFALAPNTQAQLCRAVEARCLSVLSPQRLGAEFDLIFKEPHVVRAFERMGRWGILAALGLDASGHHALIGSLKKACQAHHRRAASLEAPPSQAAVLWLVLAQCLPPAARRARQGWIGEGGQALQRFLKGPERLDQALTALSGAEAHRRNDVLAGLDAAERVCLWARVVQPEHRAVLDWWETCGRRVRSAVSGRTLVRLGYKEGPAFKPALAAALHAAQDERDVPTQLRLAQAVLEAHIESTKRG